MNICFDLKVGGGGGGQPPGSAVPALAISLGDLRWRRDHDFTVQGNPLLSKDLDSPPRDYSTL